MECPMISTANPKVYLHWLNFDTFLSRSKLDKRLKYTFDMFLIHQYFDTFSCHFIHVSYNLDMIFFDQSLLICYTFECTKVYLVYFWVHLTVNMVSNFDRLKGVWKFSQEENESFMKLISVQISTYAMMTRKCHNQDK